MKSSIKISDFAINDLFKNLNLSNNRAKAQIIRRIKDYSNKKSQYTIKSRYVKYLMDNKIIKDFNNIKKYTLPLITSFVVTDGHFTIRKKKNLEAFEIGFSNLNLELVNAFNDLIFLTYDEIPSNIDYDSRLKRTRFIASWHKSVIEEIRSYCYIDGKKFIKNILNSNTKILFECLRIALSCDGFISFYIAKEKYGYKGFDYYTRIRPELVLGCKPTTLRNDWLNLTKKLNLSFIMKDDRIKCTFWDDIECFYKLGGFIPNTFIGKDSKYFEGLDKNHILKTLLKIKKSDFNNLKSKYKENNKLKEILLNKIR